MTDVRGSKIRRAACLGALLGAWGLWGACGAGNRATIAVRRARNDLMSLSARSTKAASGTTRTVSYDQIIRDLGPIADSGRPGEASSARLLIAEARARMASA